MNEYFGKSRLWGCAFSLTMALAVGCGGETTEPTDGEEEPTVDNATDYPTTGVSEACGGKCDDPDAALYSSSARLIKNLDMINYESSEGTTETFRLTGEVIDEEYANVENGQTLKVELYAADGASNPDFKVTGELVYEEEGIGAFISDTIDTSELLPWMLLKADVTGEYGDQEITQTFDFAPGLEQGVEVLPEPEDPFAPAKDVDAGAIFIDPEVPAPDYERVSGVDGFRLDGTEFWQRWPDGHDPTFSYSAGTELGRKCMYASARRFEAIMTDPPEAIVELKENSNWGGSFFNWNDDHSHEDATGRPTGAVLWAWRTGLVKWISQTGPDGTCYLPTLGMVERAAQNCLDEAERSDGEIEGCQAY